MEIGVTIPLDEDGFIRRECPHCLRQFKWHSGPANDEAEQHQDPHTYYCPLCGQPAAPDSWWTQEQLNYAEGVATPAAVRLVEDEFKRAFKGMNSKHFKIEMKDNFDTANEPMPMVEPDDMVIVASPCHSYEPIKVPETESGPFHCLVCGHAFAI